MPEQVRVKIPSQQSVTAMVYPAAARHRAGVTLILAHGAGAGQTSDFIVDFASGLAVRGINMITFNFLYREQGRRVPDPNDRLEACWHAVIDAVRDNEEFSGSRLTIGGKSMGGELPRKWLPRTSPSLRDWYFSATRCIHRADPIAFAHSICRGSRRRCCSFKVRATPSELLTSCARS